MYALLTGMPPFADLEEIEDVQARWLKRKIPRLKNYQNFAEKKLAEAIRRCWAYDPDTRIDMASLVILLRNAVEENRQQDKRH